MNKEIFSFHITDVGPLNLARELCLKNKKVPGLIHSESLMTMRLGAPVMRPSRYGYSKLVFFARWKDEESLNKYLSTSVLQTGWHVRLKFYRRWGFVSELDGMPENILNPCPDAPVVGITLARLKISETMRFLKWGKPVETLVRDHPGSIMALAAMRPLTTLSTFSMWKNEEAMIEMVSGKTIHAEAMKEQARKSFHHEFTTMRFNFIGEFGERADLCL
jgi:hypothetical protein